MGRGAARELWGKKYVLARHGSDRVIGMRYQSAYRCQIGKRAAVQVAGCENTPFAI